MRLKKEPYLGDPKLFEPTPVIVVKPFCVNGRRVEIGQTVEVTLELARDLVHRGRAQFKNDKDKKPGWV